MQLSDAVVVITGGTGFLGRHVSAELRFAGAQTLPLGRRDFDLRDRRGIHDMLRSVRPDAVVHLAASVGGIGANRAEPGRFFYENAIMGIELLEACRTHGVAKTLISGTVCAYPRNAPTPFREDDLWNGYPEETNAPYGVAKKALLTMAQAYREQYGTNAIYLLPVNLYGPHDNFDLQSSHVIPGMIRKFVCAQAAGVRTVSLWGDGSPTREFLHVRDAARAFRLALERYDDPAPVNIGTSEEISIVALAGMIAELAGYEGAIEWDTSQPNGQPRRRLDVSRAAEFGFHARIGLREGLRDLIDWYRTSTATAVSTKLVEQRRADALASAR